MISGRVLDVSALVDYATGRIYARALVGAAARSGALVLAIPAAALLEARGLLSESGRTRLDQLCDAPPVVVDEVTQAAAVRAGNLLARARLHPTGDASVAAQVVFSARVRGWPIVTSSPERLLRLDAALEIESLP